MSHDMHDSLTARCSSAGQNPRLEVEVKGIFSRDNACVKCVEFHPTETLLLVSLCSGHICMWNYDDEALLTTVVLADEPVRVAKFITRQQWIVAGSDDRAITIFHEKTFQLIKCFDAHQDYIRSIAVHPILPYILSAGDDKLIKMWDWEKQNWTCVRQFAGHEHYVMQVKFHPLDTNVFVSASLDRTIKIWNLESSVAQFTLQGHLRGVNDIDFMIRQNRMHLVSGSDDRSVRLWDDQTKECAQLLNVNAAFVTAVCSFPEMPIVITGCQQGKILFVDSMTSHVVQTASVGKNCIWSISHDNKDLVAVGHDEGVLLLHLPSQKNASVLNW